MEILLAALVAAAVSGAVALVALRARGPAVAEGGSATRSPGVAGAPDQAARGGRGVTRPGPVHGHAVDRELVVSGQADVEIEAATLAIPAPADAPELAARAEHLHALEQRLRAREDELARRAEAAAERDRELELLREALEEGHAEQVRRLERIAGLSAGEARRELLGELEQELRHERARAIRLIEDDVRHEAERRARSILSTCMQRVAGSHSYETTATTVQLDSDELKGRIIGREGRNIRTLESLTGIDVIVDDTPGAVVLSGFDGVRREIARITLEKLLEDGRIHPARIEEAYGQARTELDRRIVELGEQAALEAGVGTVRPELTKLLGRLRFRTSYGQNVLGHSIECARLAALVAAELGANPKTAARAALLHDIGKAVSHEVEGPHALVGGELARRHGESEAVAHAMESHHNEVEPQTVEAVIVQIVDAASGARPGARGESLEHYVTRLKDLEGIAARHDGVERVYAMHAGRELRVIVEPGEVDDDGATLLSRDIAREVERELEYPGQIKVTVIRESRSTDYAR